jgi:hypothetical protein
VEYGQNTKNNCKDNCERDKQGADYPQAADTFTQPHNGILTSSEFNGAKYFSAPLIRAVMCEGLIGAPSQSPFFAPGSPYSAVARSTAAKECLARARAAARARLFLG